MRVILLLRGKLFPASWVVVRSDDLWSAESEPSLTFPVRRSIVATYCKFVVATTCTFTRHCEVTRNLFLAIPVRLTPQTWALSLVTPQPNGKLLDNYCGFIVNHCLCAVSPLAFWWIKWNYRRTSCSIFITDPLKEFAGATSRKLHSEKSNVFFRFQLACWVTQLTIRWSQKL